MTWLVMAGMWEIVQIAGIVYTFFPFLIIDNIITVIIVVWRSTMLWTRCVQRSCDEGFIEYFMWVEFSYMAFCLATSCRIGIAILSHTKGMFKKSVLSYKDGKIRKIFLRQIWKTHEGYFS